MSGDDDQGAPEPPRPDGRPEPSAPAKPKRPPRPDGRPSRAEYARKWRAAHPEYREAQRIYHRRHYALRIDRARAQVRERLIRWRAAHPGYRQLQYDRLAVARLMVLARRRAERLGLPFGLTLADIEALVEAARLRAAPDAAPDAATAPDMATAPDTAPDAAMVPDMAVLTCPILGAPMVNRTRYASTLRPIPGSTAGYVAGNVWIISRRAAVLLARTALGPGALAAGIERARLLDAQDRRWRVAAGLEAPAAGD